MTKPEPIDKNKVIHYLTMGEQQMRDCNNYHMADAYHDIRTAIMFRDFKVDEPADKSESKSCNNCGNNECDEQNSSGTIYCNGWKPQKSLEERIKALEDQHREIPPDPENYICIDLGHPFKKIYIKKPENNPSGNAWGTRDLDLCIYRNGWGETIDPPRKG